MSGLLIERRFLPLKFCFGCILFLLTENNLKIFGGGSFFFFFSLKKKIEANWFYDINTNYPLDTAALLDHAAFPLSGQSQPCTFAPNDASLLFSFRGSFGIFGVLMKCKAGERR